MELQKRTNETIMLLFKECLPLFSVLNDEKRQEIILILADSPEDGVMVNAITEKINLSRPAVSHHLKILKQEGIVDVIAKGVENYYFLTLKEAVDKIKNLLTVIEENCVLK